MTSIASVPTILQTIEAIVPPSARQEYRALIDNVARALEDRERTLYGASYVSGQPVTDEILRRLDQDEVTASDLLPEQTKGQRIRALENQVAELAMQVSNLTSFARDNGYRL